MWPDERRKMSCHFFEIWLCSAYQTYVNLTNPRRRRDVNGSSKGRAAPTCRPRVCPAKGCSQPFSLHEIAELVINLRLSRRYPPRRWPGWRD